MRLLEKRKNLRILEARPPGAAGLSLRVIDGGYLVQTPDEVSVDRSEWQVVTKVAPTDAQWADLELAWRVVAKVTSNAIVLVKDGQAVGIGCGQQNRRDAGRLAGEKAAGRAAGGAYASDAFFPFPDGLDGAIEAGAATVIQPGGSIRDDRGHRRRRRRRPGHGLHRRAPLPPLTPASARSRHLRPDAVDQGRGGPQVIGGEAGVGQQRRGLGHGEADDVAEAARRPTATNRPASPWMP